MRLITIKEASELVGMSVITIRRRVAAGTLPAIRANGQRGKLFFDKNLLLDALKKENLSNLRDSVDNDIKEPKYTTAESYKGFEEDETCVLKEQPKLSDRDYFEKMAAELGLEQVTNEDLEPTTT